MWLAEFTMGQGLASSALLVMSCLDRDDEVGVSSVRSAGSVGEAEGCLRESGIGRPLPQVVARALSRSGLQSRE